MLRRVLPDRGLVLEIAAGTGEHAASFAPAFPHLEWQPTDVDETALASIAAHRRDAGASSLREPIALDVTREPWPIASAAAIVCINMIHISPWSAARALLAGAGRLLPEGGVLYLYGPYRVGGRHTAPSNEAFDAQLRASDPEWGVRDLEAVVEEAGKHGLSLVETVEMPANNLSVVLRRG